MYYTTVIIWGFFFLLTVRIWLYFSKQRERFGHFRQGIEKGRNIIKNNGVLFDTYLYVEAHANATTAAFIILIAVTFAFLPLYINSKNAKGSVIDVAFGIYESQYGYITTSAFLHGYQPALAILLFLIAPLLVTGLLIFHSQYEQVDSFDRTSSFFSHRRSRSNYTSSRLTSKEKTYSTTQKIFIYSSRLLVEIFAQFFNFGKPILVIMLSY